MSQQVSMSQELATMYAAGCWTDKRTENKVMDPVLAEVIADKMKTLIESWQQAERNAGWYRQVLEDTAKHLGDEVKTNDVGEVTPDVFVSKVPELVGKLKLKTAAFGHRHLGNPNREENDKLPFISDARHLSVCCQTEAQETGVAESEVYAVKLAELLDERARLESLVAELTGPSRINLIKVDPKQFLPTLPEHEDARRVLAYDTKHGIEFAYYYDGKWRSSVGYSLYYVQWWAEIPQEQL